MKPVERLAIGADAKREVDVLGVVGAAGALQGPVAHDDVQVLVAAADAEPEPGEAKGWSVDLFKLEDVAVEAPGALEIVDADENVVEVRFGHDEVPVVLIRLIKMTNRGDETSPRPAYVVT